ncbi:MAG TPA: hypothetical protein VGZ26_10030 [Pirellulales bacterium]|nr:hypothetical protein [Pirellulales bacterium]
MSVLTQFIFRLSFGLALGMALSSPRQVTSGYYRVHLYVLLGLNVLATMAALGAGDPLAIALPLAAAILSYVGSVCWLYEKPRAGRVSLAMVAAVTLLGAWSATDWRPATSPATTLLTWFDPLTSGLVLGLTIAAMFLGHWYLNTPTMAIGPLEKLVVLMGAAIGVRAVVEGAGLALNLWRSGVPGTEQLLFVALRWLSGIFGAMALTVMAWKTLKIPNTQSATGILYVAVIATFLGELTSLLLTAQSENPL